MSASFADTLSTIDADLPPLTIPLGLRADNGTMLFIDLAIAPHALLAGVTGSGKSVGLNVGISTIMTRNDPADVRFWMIDPKRVELSAYRKSAFVDHVVTDMDDAADLLEALVAEMERRYSLFEDWGVKKLSAYIEESGEHLPMIVMVIDELADLMDTHRKVVEPLIIRLAQLSRAAGIHILMATQRPGADTIPKRIMSNVPTRIGYRTQSHTESRLILNERGAEDLAGNGELLALVQGGKGLIKAQGPYISDEEIDEVVALNPAIEEAFEFDDEDDEIPEPESDDEPGDKPNGSTWHGIGEVKQAAPQHDMGDLIARAIAETATQTRMADLEEIDRLKRRVTELGISNDELAGDLASQRAKTDAARTALHTTRARVDELEKRAVLDEDELKSARRAAENARRENRALKGEVSVHAMMQTGRALALVLGLTILSVAAIAIPALSPYVVVGSLIVMTIMAIQIAGNLTSNKRSQINDWKHSTTR